MFTHLIAMGVIGAAAEPAPPADVGSLIAGAQRTLSPLKVPTGWSAATHLRKSEAESA